MWIARLGLTISAVFRRVVPDPFTIAVLLTGLTFVMAVALGDFAPAAAAPAGAPAGLAERAAHLLDAWRSEAGLWAFLGFSMQMCLVLVTGHALASARAVSRLLARLSDLPGSSRQAAMLVTAVACGAALLNWGLGLIVGALLARGVALSLRRRGLPVHYPLVVAAGYLGLMVWHGGLSGSAPLSMTSIAGAAKVLPAGTLARLDGVIPLERTIFSGLNLAVTGGMVVLAVAVVALLSPADPAEMQGPPEDLLETELGPADGAGGGGTVPDRLDTSRVMMLLLALPLALAVARRVATGGAGSIGLNEINAAMLAVGLVLHGSLRAYAAAAEPGARACAPIIIQFPLYAGIMAMLLASGLARQIATGITQVAGADTLPIFTFLAGCVINMFIPSGGGQWGVQGPIALESALDLGVDPALMVMSVAYGDQVTNMLQPFWALPLLAITGARARDIVGYCAVVMVVAGLWAMLCLLVLA
ncbi:MAG TPA: TIGR00366 family protein [Phycisphaerales bacterium]|nr:TIGR00366 family protein [Phycisphaerales bacterium]